ncbi:MAG: hypothetical protein AAFQ77_03095 [Myxococcota bacterium]
MRATRRTWAERVRGYCDEQELYESHDAYCEANGWSRAAFRYWLYHLTAGVPGVRGSRRVFLDVADGRMAVASGGLVAAQPQPTSRIVLDARDVAILRELAHDRVCGVDVVAMRYFSNEREALRAIRRLQRGGHVKLLLREGGVVSLSRKGANAIGVRAPRRMHPRHLTHHLKTLRAIELFRASVEARGGRFVAFDDDSKSPGYRLEIHVQAAARRGSGTVRGMSYDAAPDGVVNVAWPDGRVEAIAVEYYTSSYSDAQMREKTALQQQYAGVHQVADSPRTAERVQHATGAACSVL